MKNKGTIYAAFIIVSVVVIFYLYVRTGQINSLKAEIAKVSAENAAATIKKAGPAINEGMFPEKAGTALFVERLYDAARLAGIKKHEVSSIKASDVPLRKNVIKGRAAEGGKTLKTYSFKISLEGNYRETAEYIREVQNIERFKHITEFMIKPADKLLKTDMTIEIYSLGGQDAAQ